MNEIDKTIVNKELDERTALIKHHEKAVQNNVFSIGKELLYIQDKSLWKGKYPSLKGYIEDNFTFSDRQARKFMNVTTRFGYKSELSSLGITKLYILTQVPDEHIEEVIKRVTDRVNPPISVIEQEISRFKHHSGSKPHYSDDPKEHITKLIRQFSEIEALSDSHNFIKSELKDSLLAWINSAEKYEDSELDKLKTKANEKLDKL